MEAQTVVKAGLIFLAALVITLLVLWLQPRREMNTGGCGPRALLAVASHFGNTETETDALYASTVLVGVFAAYSTWRWMQGIPVLCHCVGILFQLSPAQSITLDLGLLPLIGGLFGKSENLGSVPISLAQRGKTPETTA